MGDGYVHYHDSGDGPMGAYMSKLIKVHTLNMCNLLYTNYILTEFFKSKKSKYYAYTLTTTLRIYHKESEMCTKM